MSAYERYLAKKEDIKHGTYIPPQKRLQLGESEPVSQKMSQYTKKYYRINTKHLEPILLAQIRTGEPDSVIEKYFIEGDGSSLPSIEFLRELQRITDE